jgi:ketosteroid isomerase-like protein
LCSTPHHKECWEENKGCTTYGCPNNPNTETMGEETFESLDVGNQTIDDIKQELEKQKAKPKATIKCPKCNIPIDKDSDFCNHCGHFLKEDASRTEKSKFEKEYRKLYKEKVNFKRKRLLITTSSILILTILFIVTFYYSYKLINNYFSSDEYQEKNEVNEFILNWEKAWESKDTNRYKEYLDKDYIFYDDEGNAVDYQNKIKRIKYTFNNYEYIEIDVDDIKIEKKPETPNYLNVTFTQNYESDKFEQKGVKTLRLYKGKDTENRWKIFREYFEEYK